MEVLCKRCIILVHGLIVGFISLVNGQGGGVAIGLGGGDFMLGSPFGGGLPSPFLPMAPTDSAQPGPTTGPPSTAGVTVGAGLMGSTLQTATVSTIGNGFNPSDLFSMFGGTGQGVAVNSGQNTYDIQTQPPTNPTTASQVTTKKATIEIDNPDQKGYILQNEAYTPIGSVGNLVKVPTNSEVQSNTAKLQIPPKINNDFADIIVKPVSPIHTLPNTNINSGTAQVNNNKPSSLSTENFNPGTGMADEIAALQSSMLGSPVDMSSFVPPPSGPVDMSVGPVSSIGDLPVPAEFSTNPDTGVPVNRPTSTNMDTGTTGGFNPEYNPNMNVNTGGNTASLSIAPQPGTIRNAFRSSGNNLAPNTNINVDPQEPPRPRTQEMPPIGSRRSAFGSGQNTFVSNNNVNVDAQIQTQPGTGGNQAVGLDRSAFGTRGNNFDSNTNINTESQVPPRPKTEGIPPTGLRRNAFGTGGNDFGSNNNMNVDSQQPPQPRTEGNQPARSNRNAFGNNRNKFDLNTNTNLDPQIPPRPRTEGMPQAGLKQNAFGPGGNDFVSNNNVNIDSQNPPQQGIEGNQPATSNRNAFESGITDFAQNSNMNVDPRLPPQATQESSQPVRSRLRDMFSSPEQPTQDQGLPGSQSNQDRQNTPNTGPQLQDMTAEGIYPFEGGSTGRTAIGESGALIQDMNKAIADHNATDTLHLENQIKSMSEVPPLAGTNGGRITNLVDVKPPQPVDGGMDMANLPASDRSISKPNLAVNKPASFVVGAGMPNAQVIQPEFVPDTAAPSANSQPDTGILPIGDATSMFGNSNPGLMNSGQQMKDVLNTPPSSNMQTGIDDPSLKLSTRNDQIGTLRDQPRVKGGLSRAFGGVDQPLVENTISNIDTYPNTGNPPTQNMMVKDIPNSIDMASPGVDPRSQNINAKVNDALSPSDFGASDRINNMEMTGTDIGLVSQQRRQPLVNAPKLVETPPKASLSIDPGTGDPFIDSRSPMNQNNQIVEPLNTAQNIGLMQEPFKSANEQGLGVKTMSDIGRLDKPVVNSASNQQIVAVRPEWLTNVFGKIGNALQTNTGESQTPPQNSMNNFGGEPNILRRNRNDFNTQPSIKQLQDLRNALSNQMIPNSASDGLQIVPLQNRGPQEPQNKVFTLGAHRVLDTVPSVQPPIQDIMTDYQTQNVIGTSETKPLVPDGAPTINNIQIAGISPNSVEMQLKNMMMLQDAQMAMSNPQKSQPDSSSIFTAFEAPGMSIGRSVAVQESFGRKPNIVTIQAESNVPVTDNRPPQQIAGGLNEVSSKVPIEQIIEPNLNVGIGPGQNPRMPIGQPFTNDLSSQSFPSQGNVVTGQQINAIDKFANGLKLGQPVTNTNTRPTSPGSSGRGIMLPMSADATPFTSGSREAVFGSGVNTGPQTLNTGRVNNNLVGQGNYPALMCNYVADPTDELYFMIRQRGGYQRQRCALGTAFDPATCECSRRIEDSADCLEVHMDFNNGIVEDSSFNKLPIGNDNVEVTNKSTPLSGIALFNSNSKLTIWRYQNYDFRDHVMLKVQFRPGQSGDRFQPLISNCDGGLEGPSIGIIYDNIMKEVLLVLKTTNDTKKELSFPINADQWNDVTYIYDGVEFVGIVNGVRRYVSRTDPHLLGIIGGDIKSRPARGLIEIRDAGIILGGCPRYGGHYNGAMVDIQIYTCIPKNFRLE